MQLDKDTLRKLRGLIIFTLVILVGLWRFSIVLQAVKTILHILFPFLLGGAIAFVLSVPMNRIRKRLFANAKEKQKKEADTAHARERKLQETMLDIKKRFGKNAILKGLNLEDGATARERNNQIGGHKA